MRFEPWYAILIVLACVALISVVRSFVVRVTGTWERVDEGLKGGRVERITLVQFGPFVRGRRLVPGGFQQLSGYIRGRTIVLTRRDHGEEMLMRQGFPPEVVKEVDGSVTAKLELTLSADELAIFGTFTPQKIEFTVRPPKVTSRRYLEATYRRYRLLSRKILDEEDPVPTAKKPLRKTV